MLIVFIVIVMVPMILLVVLNVLAHLSGKVKHGRDSADDGPAPSDPRYSNPKFWNRLQELNRK